VTDTKAKPRIGYAIVIQTHASGHVDVWHYTHAAEGMPGWFPTEHEARADAAKRVSRMIQQLHDHSTELTRDKRSR